MPKILVSDYDKTFYLNDEDIEKNKERVKKFREAGNIFVIATGRSYLDLKSRIDKYDLEYDFIIINHGATIIGKDGEILYNFTINNDIDVSKINETISNKYEEINSYHVSKNTIEIISKDTNKSNAIKLLANYYHLDETAIYTVGDGYSDISMIKDYNGYAMNGSVPELKQFAVKTVDSVSELIDEIMIK